MPLTSTMEAWRLMDLHFSPHIFIKPDELRLTNQQTWKSPPSFGDPYSVLSSGTPEPAIDNSPHKDSSKELREDRRVSLLYRVYRTRRVH